MDNSCIHVLGEAKYIDDMPLRADELHGTFVLSTMANCSIDKIDASEALVIHYTLVLVHFTSKTEHEMSRLENGRSRCFS